MKKLFNGLALAAVGLLIFVVSFFIGASLTETMPRVMLYATGINQWEYQPRSQSVIYYSDGQVMTRLGYQRVYSDSFPALMEQAVVAVEDKRFYEHSGLDARGIGRAIIKNLQAGNKAEGGSTITQQLARTLFLSQEKTYTRKIKEVFLATAIEEKYGKDAILNMYMNEIYMGRGCSGLPCAAQSYFGKDVINLNQAEICMLVGLIQSPEYYAPERNYTGMKERQETVVDVLVEQGIIGAAEGENIKKQPLNIKPYDPDTDVHPYFTIYLRNQLEEMLGKKALYQAGLKIYSTVDSRMQERAEAAVANHARSLAKQGITAQDMALVSIEPSTGAIRAMVGGVDFSKNQLNMAVLARQPGSAIKPLYYAAAIDKGIIEADTEINNKPRNFGNYTPKNLKPAPAQVSVWEALVNSYNVASVEILNLLGLDTAVSYLESFGITTVKPEDKHLALALGGMSEGISPLQMAAAFAVFADGGWYHQYYAIEKIEEASGKNIWMKNTKTWRVLSDDANRVMDDILQSVVKYGTGTAARIALPSGGKTGTTSDSRDLWYVGYTRELCTAVWAGNSSGAVVSGWSTYGGSVSAPVWRDYMNSLFYNYVFEEKPAPVVEETPAENEEEEKTAPEEGPDQTPDTGNEENAALPPLEPQADVNTGGQYERAAPRPGFGTQNDPGSKRSPGLLNNTCQINCDD